MSNFRPALSQNKFWWPVLDRLLQTLTKVLHQINEVSEIWLLREVTKSHRHINGLDSVRFTYALWIVMPRACGRK
jgi:hypothetical protein